MHHFFYLLQFQRCPCLHFSFKSGRNSPCRQRPTKCIISSTFLQFQRCPCLLFSFKSGRNSPCRQQPTKCIISSTCCSFNAVRVCTSVLKAVGTVLVVSDQQNASFLLLVAVSTLSVSALQF